MKHDPLLDRLRAAFPPEPIDSEGAFEQRGTTYCDGVEYARQMDGKTWEQLDPNFFARRIDALAFLGDSPLVSVLPLYLHLLLVFKPTSPVPETLLPLLTNPEPTDEPAKLFGWQDRRFRGLTQRLTDQQRSVVATVLLEFIATAPNQAEPARRALDRYWRAFTLPADSSPSRARPTVNDDLLVDELREAFPRTPITAADAFISERAAPHDAPDYRRRLDGKTWEQLDPRFFARSANCLYHLRAGHLVALLPLYLRLLLVFEPSTSRVPRALLSLLTKPEVSDDLGNLFDWRKQRFEGLTERLSDPQKRVVAATLVRFDEMYSTYDVQRILDRYWHAFVEGLPR